VLPANHDDLRSHLCDNCRYVLQKLPRVEPWKPILSIETSQINAQAAAGCNLCKWFFHDSYASTQAGRRALAIEAWKVKYTGHMKWNTGTLKLQGDFDRATSSDTYREAHSMRKLTSLELDGECEPSPYSSPPLTNYRRSHICTSQRIAQRNADESGGHKHLQSMYFPS
jgi:hypothetical protein